MLENQSRERHSHTTVNQSHLPFHWLLNINTKNIMASLETDIHGEEKPTNKR